MRIVINADLNEERDPDVPLIRSQLMIEYGPVELAARPISVPSAARRSRGPHSAPIPRVGMIFTLYSDFETMINDVTFGGYHKFGSEARILPGFEETDKTRTPAPKDH